MKKALKHLIAIAAFAFCGSASAALLDGKCLRYQYYFPDAGDTYGSSQTQCVDGGWEFEMLDDVARIDVSDTSFVVDFRDRGTFTDSSFNGFRLRDYLGNISAFTSVSIDFSNLSGFGASRLTFDANNIWLNFEGLSFTRDTLIRVNINGTPTPVPEPAGLGLLALALIGAAFAGRRRK